MTTFLLHGGLTSKQCSNNRDFYVEMASRVKKNGIWLGCYFASDETRKKKKFLSDKRKILRSVKHKIECIFAEPQKFEQQLAKADMIYFAGGTTLKLMDELKRYKNLKNLLQQCNVVAGSSAGMNILGKEWLGKSSQGKGLGLLPMSMVVHYGAPEYANQHKNITLPAPILKLRETQFVVIEQ
ncbi:MAG: Type 1 glutamine amidotransferase-like domain-containing protein [Alphaproteobacteria bacterium]|nr:Type 1 glutamine amidotransferase-like domain-containing protein [Alphaproteobacteria bacterium]